jgi:hypothetical protein
MRENYGALKDEKSGAEFRQNNCYSGVLNRNLEL